MQRTSLRSLACRQRALREEEPQGGRKGKSLGEYRVLTETVHFRSGGKTKAERHFAYLGQQREPANHYTGKGVRAESHSSPWTPFCGSWWRGGGDPYRFGSSFRAAGGGGRAESSSCLCFLSIDRLHLKINLPPRRPVLGLRVLWSFIPRTWSFVLELEVCSGSYGWGWKCQ